MPVGSHQQARGRIDMCGPSPPIPPGNDDQNALTNIPQRIHCAATQTQGDGNGLTETDRITLDHFFDTLAEVAMAVARREIQQRSEGTE